MPSFLPPVSTPAPLGPRTERGWRALSPRYNRNAIIIGLMSNPGDPVVSAAAQGTPESSRTTSASTTARADTYALLSYVQAVGGLDSDEFRQVHHPFTTRHYFLEA